MLLPACAALHNLVLSPGEARVVLQHGGVPRLLRAMKECGYRRPIAVSGLTTLLALCLAAGACSPPTFSFHGFFFGRRAIGCFVAWGLAGVAAFTVPAHAPPLPIFLLPSSPSSFFPFPILLLSPFTS